MADVIINKKLYAKESNFLPIFYCLLVSNSVEFIEFTYYKFNIFFCLILNPVSYLFEYKMASTFDSSLYLPYIKLFSLVFVSFVIYFFYFLLFIFYLFAFIFRWSCCFVVHVLCLTMLCFIFFSVFWIPAVEKWLFERILWMRARL